MNVATCRAGRLPRTPGESRWPRPLGRKASFLTSHPNPSSNLPLSSSLLPPQLPSLSPTHLSRVLEQREGSLRSPHPATRIHLFFPQSGIPIPPYNLICFYPEEIILAPHSHLPIACSPFLLSPRYESSPCWTLSSKAVRPTSFVPLPCPCTPPPYGSLNPPPYPLSAPSRPQPTLPECPHPARETPSALWPHPLYLAPGRGLGP